MTTLRDTNNFGTVKSIRVADKIAWAENDVTDSAYLAYLYKLPTNRTFWVKQGNYGTFAYPEDYRSWLDIFLYPDLEMKQGYKLIEVSVSASHPLDCWLLPFVDMTPHADNNGQHYGTHPTGAWVIEKKLLDVFVNASQGKGALPGVQAPPPIGSVKVMGFSKNQRYLNIRTEPNEKAKIISWLYKGDTVILLPDTEVKDGTYIWRKVKKLNFVGWVAWNLVLISL